MKSFSFPFVALRDVELEQPVFGANYIKGKVLAQPNGNFEGEAKFKLRFKSGGAIDFGQAMLKAAQMGNAPTVGNKGSCVENINFVLFFQRAGIMLRTHLHPIRHLADPGMLHHHLLTPLIRTAIMAGFHLPTCFQINLHVRFNFQSRKGKTSMPCVFL